MSMMERLVNALKSVPPKVKQGVNEAQAVPSLKYDTEFAEEPFFEAVDKSDYKKVAIELWKILEDIEKTELVTPNDHEAFRSIVKELTKKRFVYLANEIELEKLEDNLSNDTSE